MSTFAKGIIDFLKGLDFSESLPEGISVLNPYSGNINVMPVVSAFYRKYYNDYNTRNLILGINPGRFGAGATGIPFTDTIRLKEKCGLAIAGVRTYETSSVFIYDVIEKYGGPEKFYASFFISSVSPLGFILTGENGRIKNYNYYDSSTLRESIKGFAVDSLRRQLELGIRRDICFCLGTGGNYRYLSALNNEFMFFGKIEPLEHPRFIMQYRSKRKQFYVDSYLGKLSAAVSDGPF